MKSNRRISIFLAIYLLFTLFITVFSRVPTLTRTVHLDLLWSYTSHGHWKQLLLNIALFIPLGYYLRPVFSASKHPRLWPIFTALMTSLTIELTQFLTYRGMLDVDDLISNTLGACVGLMIWEAIRAGWRKKATWIMLAAGLIGCIMTGVPAAKNGIGTIITKQFAFTISSVSVDDGKTVLEGECFLYDRATPAYTILIDNAPATTIVDGNKFKAEVAALSGKAKVQIKFHGFPVMPTGTWINGDRVEYVAGVEPIIRGVPEEAVLKAWNKEYDILVYQDRSRLLWLVGTEIDCSTEIIYHIYADEPELLPENRVQYGFDNRGFRPPADELAANELESIEHYRVFERELPNEYHITAIVVGVNMDGAIIWTDSFRIQ